ncbi:MAG: hypothetical protein GYB66_11960 [Chloroflexi bacterium]|nr:hypothetical protein [Chloroflexota bacterium]
MMEIPYQSETSAQQSDSPVAPLAEINFRVSLEVLAYIGLFVLALILRVLALDAVPLDDRQAHEALAALQRVDDSISSDEPLIANNPLMAFANQFLFFLAGTSDTLARLPTAVVGASMVWGPLLWRRYLGASTALVMAILLGVSSVALASARTMGAVTWTMVLVFIAVWLVMRFVERRQQSDGIAATVVLVMLLVLVEPTGVITVAGLLAGLMMALWRSNRDDDHESHPVTILGETLKDWPWRDGLLAAFVAVLVIGTGFFSTPDGLSAVGNSLYEFAQGIGERQPGATSAFALAVAVRYDLGLILLGLVGLYFALSEGDFVSRFLAGWFVWGVVMGLLYVGATASAALWLTVPAAGLTATLVARMLRSASIGYWVVPDWGIFLHAVATAVFLAAIALSATRLGRVVQRETLPVYYHRIAAEDLTSAARIGTIDQSAGENTFELTVGAAQPVTIQIKRLDSTIDPVLQVVRLEGEEQVGVFGPYSYPDSERGLVQTLQFDRPGVYLAKVRQADNTIQRGQFAFLTFDGDVAANGLFGSDLWPGYQLDATSAITFVRIVANNQLTPTYQILVTFFLIMLLVIVYFLAGSIWGARAAWRGLGFGVLIYFVIYGVGLGWQASVTFADDPRELWQTGPATTNLDLLVGEIEEMSYLDAGIRTQLDITVQGPEDGALAWALRGFDNVQYVDGLGIEVDSGAVIAPYDPEIPPILGADYIGQDFVLGETWSLSQLRWTDTISWLTLRETRFEPDFDEHVTLWVRKDVYGVREVPGTQ